MVFSSGKLLALALLCGAVSLSQSFTPTPPMVRNLAVKDTTTTATTGLYSSNDSETPSSKSSSTITTTLDVVLMGVGDLRLDDHLGWHAALTTSSTRILPLCILDAASASRIPGVMAHTADTAACLGAALTELEQEVEQLRNTRGDRVVKELQVILGADKDLTSCLGEVLTKYCTASSNPQEGDPVIRIHVCDLGAADNQMGYGPYSQLLKNDNDSLPGNCQIVPWTQDLRSEPWKDDSFASFSTDYTKYERQFVKNQPASQPMDVVGTSNSNSASSSSNKKSIPSADDLKTFLTEVASQRNSLLKQAGRVEAEQASGLYATHWGGLDAASTLGCRTALELLNTYIDNCQQDDATWFAHPRHPRTQIRNNKDQQSLEHAAMVWQLAGDGSSPVGKADNWMAGEGMIRFLTAPLLFGTLSPRRIWHQVKAAEEQSSSSSSSILSKLMGGGFSSPVQQMVEAREWHQLLAARNIACEPSAYGDDSTNQADGDGIRYRYWRYQGFLCRYAVQSMTKQSLTSTPAEKDGLLLIHGFGASGSQWNKAMSQVAEQQAQSTLPPTFDEGLAPDLIGFGQAEKPAISYTGYMWDSQVLDFVKECAVPQHDWSSFVVGGNSIGGFTSMSMAASDTATVDQILRNTPNKNLFVNSNGAPGSNMCQGLVLMNSAGPVKTAEEIQQEKEEARLAMQQDMKNRLPQYSIAQVTAVNALPLCKPPWRPMARGFGNALLAYLRPNIQSICVNLYPTNPSAVDEDLCQAIDRDSLDPGAIYVMMAGAKLPVPRTANELLKGDYRMGLVHDKEEESRSDVLESTFDGPVLIAQGVLDPLNDAQDRLERFGGLRDGVTMDAIQAGHCPHDELPDMVAKSILSWKRGPTSSSEASTADTPFFVAMAQ